jgi:hypothetical protein
MVNFYFYNSLFCKPKHVPYFLIVEIEVQKLLNDQNKLQNSFIAHPNPLNYINKQKKIVNLVWFKNLSQIHLEFTKTWTQT